MRLIYIYIIFFVFFVLFTKNKAKKVVFVVTLTMYLFSSISALWIYNVDYQGTPILIEAVIFHIVMFFLLLYPLQRFDKVKYVGISPTPEKKLRWLAVIVISLSLIEIYSDIQNINMQTLISDVNNLRSSLMEGAFRETNVILRYLNYFAGQYWGIALCLAFYYIMYYPNKRILIVLLLISSLSVIVSGIVVAAREYLIKYLYLFLILTYWFYEQMSVKWRRTIRISVIVFASAFISFFLFITILRFGESSSYSSSPIHSLLSYYGQGVINFSSIFSEFPNGATGGALKFPFFVGKSMTAYNINDTVVTDVNLNSFSTTIGSWVFDVGIIWTVIITFIHFFIFKHIGKRRVTIFNLIYIVWIYDFIFSCLFFYNEVINGTRIVTILLIVLYEKLSFQTSKSIDNKLLPS